MPFSFSRKRKSQDIQDSENQPPPPPPTTDSLQLPPPPPSPPPPSLSLHGSVDMELPKERWVQEISTTEEEHYLGGFTSAYMHLKGRGLSSMGYGVYVTNKRIIGVNSKKGLLQGMGVLLGGAVGIGLIVASRDDSSAKTIAQLEEKKDFEVSKADVAEIEITKPRNAGMVTFGKVGYLNIVLNSGGSIKVTMAYEEAFEGIRNLMAAFCPERLRVEE